MSEIDELFDGASDALRKPAVQAGSFNLAGLFDEEEPQVPNVARPVPQSEAADVTSGAPAAEPLNEVQRPKPVRPLRADGSVDVARRSAEPLPAELPSAPPVVPLTRSADAATAAPAITEPLQWLKPSDIAEAATARSETRPSAQPAETSRSSANEVQWAPRRASSAPGPGAAALAAAPVQPVDRAPAVTPAQQPSRLTMTSRDWVVSVISLGITAAAIVGIFALLK